MLTKHFQNETSMTSYCETVSITHNLKCQKALKLVFFDTRHGFCSLLYFALLSFLLMSINYIDMVTN